MRALFPILLLSGCSLFGGRAGLGTNPTPSVPSHLDVTLVSQCARPVEICCGSEKCVGLVAGATRVVHAETTGDGQVFVSIKGVSGGVFADVTFNKMELDATCEHLERRISPRPAEF